MTRRMKERVRRILRASTAAGHGAWHAADVSSLRTNEDESEARGGAVGIVEEGLHLAAAQAQRTSEAYCLSHLPPPRPPPPHSMPRIPLSTPSCLRPLSTLPVPLPTPGGARPPPSPSLPSLLHSDLQRLSLPRPCLHLAATPDAPLAGMLMVAAGGGPQQTHARTHSLEQTRAGEQQEAGTQGRVEGQCEERPCLACAAAAACAASARGALQVSVATGRGEVWTKELVVDVNDLDGVKLI